MFSKNEFISPGAAIMIDPRTGSGLKSVSLVGGYIFEENSGFFPHLNHL